MSRALIPVLLAVVLDLVGFGIVIPLLTFYAEEYQAGAMEVTMLMAIYSLAQFLMAPVWGGLSDKIGRRPVMLFSLAMSTVCLAGFAWADTLVLLFVFRALHGAGAANISTAQACVADLTTPEKRAMGMGFIGAAFGFGFTIGPVIGGVMSHYWGHTAPIWLAAGLAGLNLLLAAVMLPETRDPSTQRAERTRDPRALLRAIAHPVVGLCILLTFVMTIAFAGMESTFTLFGEHVHGLSALDIGLMFGAAGVTMIIVQGGLVGRLVKRFGEAKLLPAGLVLLTIGLALLPFAPPTMPMVAVFTLIAIGQGIASPSLHALISRGTDPSEQGIVLGANQSMSALARAIGPTLAGGLYLMGPASPFLASAAVIALSLPLAMLATRRWRPTKAA
jgi:DHA1 family tetracycline resistance protein-like MFS transporter